MENLRGPSQEETEWKEPKPLSETEIEQIKRTAYEKYREADMGDANTDLTIQAIDWQIGQRFDSHGIAKGYISEQFDQLLNLLNNGIDPDKLFHTAPLEVNPDDKASLGPGFGTAGGTSSKGGSFVLLGKPDKTIEENGFYGVIVNDVYYEAIERLSEAFPNIVFIKADQINDRLKEIVEKTNK